MESMEGYHAEQLQLPVRLCSYSELQRTSAVVELDRLPRVADSPPILHQELPWVCADNLMGGECSYVPMEMVHTNYTLPRVAGSGFFAASSNGLASGNSIEEATVHGICEIIERDAITLWNERRIVDLDRSGIDLETVDDPLCLSTLQKLDHADLNCHVWDITSDIGIPTFYCVLFDRGADQGHIGVGSGTHLSREVALLRALHEAVQVRTTYIVGARDDITLDEYTTVGMAEKRDFFASRLNRSSFSRPFTSIPDCATDFLDQDLDVLLSVLAGIGISQVLKIDLTRPEFNIPVVRIVIPGLEAPHDDDGYQPGARALAVREHPI